MPTLNAKSFEQIYLRQLPGGGFVAIEVAPTRGLLGGKYRGSVVVERRGTSARRSGHAAPIVAEARAPTIAAIFDELFPLTQSNVAVATACLARCGA